jgi:helicase
MKRILTEDKTLFTKDNNSHEALIEAIDETHGRVRHGCKADLLDLVSIRNVGRKRARQMVNHLGVSNVNDVASLTDRDMQKLANLRGWSPRLVENLVSSASRSTRRSR